MLAALLVGAAAWWGVGSAGRGTESPAFQVAAQKLPAVRGTPWQSDGLAPEPMDAPAPTVGDDYPQRFRALMAEVKDKCAIGPFSIACAGSLCALQGRPADAPEQLVAYLHRPGQLLEVPAAQLGVDPARLPCVRAQQALFGPSAKWWMAEASVDSPLRCSIHVDPDGPGLLDVLGQGEALCQALIDQEGSPSPSVMAPNAP